MVVLEATEISGLAEPTYNSGAANKKYVDALSSNSLTNYYPSSLGKGVSGAVLPLTNWYTESSQKLSDISGNLRANFIFSTQALSIFAHSTNINSRFVASGVILTSISSQSISSNNLITPHINYGSQYISLDRQICSVPGDGVQISGGNLEVINDGSIILGIEAGLNSAVDINCGTGYSALLNLGDATISYSTVERSLVFDNGEDNDRIHISGMNVGINTNIDSFPNYNLEVNGSLFATSISGISLTLPNGILGNASISYIRDEDDMASNSDISLATQQSIKAYVDANTFNPESYATSANIIANYVKSTNALSIFAHSTNINSRFKDSSSVWVFVSSQSISGSSIITGDLNLNANTISGLIDPIYPSAASNKHYVDTISGALDAKIDALGSFDPTNYITSSNSLSIFAHSTNINSRFVASGTRLYNISTQSISGGSIYGILQAPPMLFNVANIQISAQQNINLTNFDCPTGKKAYIWQASACGSGGTAVSGLKIQMLAGSTLPLTTSIYSTSSQIIQIGYPLAESAAGDHVEIRFMYSGGGNSIEGTGYKFGSGFMNISVY